MTITPVVPVADSQLVADTASIILGTDVAFVSVRVYISSWVDVWDSTSGFLNGWGGQFITWSGGERLVLDPPSPFSPGDVVYVNAWDTGGPIDYTFRVGLEKLTTEADLSSPQVVKVDTYQWSARVHNNEDPAGLPAFFDGPGNVYLHVLDPRGSEILTVPGNQVGLAWDEGRNKVIIYFVRNEAIFYMEADPGDTPSTQSQIRSLESSVRVIAGGEGHYAHDEASFPPIKLPLEQAVGAIFGGDNVTWHQGSPHNAAPAPTITSGNLSGPPVTIAVQRPTSTLEDELLVGYYLVKFFRDTPSIIGYKTMGPDDEFVVFIDSSITDNAEYAVIPVYRTSYDSTETVQEEVGPRTRMADNSVSQAVPGIFGGENSVGESRNFYGDETFPPTKLATYQDVDAVFGGDSFFYWLDSSFDPIGT